MELVPASKPPAVVVDANLVIGLCAKEANKYSKAKAKLEYYATNGWRLFAPGVVVGEVLYVLCKKQFDGIITAAEYAQAVQDFVALMSKIDPPPLGDASLVARAEQIRANYGCARASDAIYLALAEQLKVDGAAEVVTFDEGMKLQAAANAPTVDVELLEVLTP